MLRVLHIILLLPLFVTFSQAAEFSNIDCRLCAENYSSQPPCCREGLRQDVAGQRMPVDLLHEDDSGCPHGELCRELNDVVLSVSPAVPVGAGIVRQIPDTAVVMPAFGDAAEGSLVVKPPPPEDTSRYLLFCTFLI